MAGVKSVPVNVSWVTRGNDKECLNSRDMKHVWLHNFDTKLVGKVIVSCNKSGCARAKWVKVDWWLVTSVNTTRTDCVLVTCRMRDTRVMWRDEQRCVNFRDRMYVWVHNGDTDLVERYCEIQLCWIRSNVNEYVFVKSRIRGHPRSDYVQVAYIECDTKGVNIFGRQTNNRKSQKTDGQSNGQTDGQQATTRQKDRQQTDKNTIRVKLRNKLKWLLSGEFHLWPYNYPQNGRQNTSKLENEPKTQPVLCTPN